MDEYLIVQMYPLLSDRICTLTDRYDRLRELMADRGENTESDLFPIASDVMDDILAIASELHV